MESVAIESLGPITLTADWQVSTKVVRVDSRSQMQFYADYDPHASEEAGAGRCEIQILYSNQPGDTNYQPGGSFAWRGFTDEEDQGDHSSLMYVRTWKIPAAGLEFFERDPTWARPMANKVITYRAREVGVSTFGTVSLSVAAQRI